MIKELYNQVNRLSISNDSEYVLLAINSSKNYFGKNSDGKIVFVEILETNKHHPSIQVTSLLSLHANIECTFLINGNCERHIANILTCKTSNVNDIYAFIRLCSAFNQEKDVDTSSLFSSLVHLFSSIKKDKREITGFFAELYISFYLLNKKINITNYWQKKDRMKYDYMIDDSKRMDVKSSTTASRIHHFKHEQLQYEEYDIIIASVLLRECNVGISVADMIDFGRNIYSNDYKRLAIIENMTRNYDDDELNNIVFDKNYLENNIRFISAKDIHRFVEQKPTGITNAEYDSDLTDCNSLSDSELVTWFSVIEIKREQNND